MILGGIAGSTPFAPLFLEHCLVSLAKLSAVTFLSAQSTDFVLGRWGLHMIILGVALTPHPFLTSVCIFASSGQGRKLLSLLSGSAAMEFSMCGFSPSPLSRSWSLAMMRLLDIFLERFFMRQLWIGFILLYHFCGRASPQRFPRGLRYMCSEYYPVREIRSLGE